jgi:hypothetical protein
MLDGRQHVEQSILVNSSATSVFEDPCDSAHNTATLMLALGAQWFRRNICSHSAFTLFGSQQS